MSTEYDAWHRAERARHIAKYAPGKTPCFICGQAMTGRPRQLHLAHAYPRGHPARRSGPRGLAHARCNIGDAGRLALARLRGIDPQPRTRRQW